MTPPTLRVTPLHEAHCRLGARMVDFAGWDMPVQYGGVMEEHLAVRTAAGIFDVSHMGEVFVHGPDALANLQRLTSNDVSRLADGQAQYTAITTPQGTFVDDVLVHRLAAHSYFLCVNAANTEKDFQWIRERAAGKVQVEDRSGDYAQIAVQGPLSLQILGGLTDCDLPAIGYYWFRQDTCCGHPAILSRTGYTGEDGFEVYIAPQHAGEVWEALLSAGRSQGLLPAGLAARNTLRLEASMALYGNDIDDTTSVLEADLAWIVKFQKGDFLGRQPLLDQKQHGVSRRLVGFEMIDKGIAREHYPVLVNGKEVGQVTSGSYAPFLKKNIGLAYLPAESARVDTRFEVVIRGKALAARVVPTPFYKRRG